MTDDRRASPNATAGWRDLRATLSACEQQKE